MSQSQLSSYQSRNMSNRALRQQPDLSGAATRSQSSYVQPSNKPDPILNTDSLPLKADDGVTPIPANPPPSEEDQLSEAELRKLYNEDEIDRFLGLFAAYVTEVVLPSSNPGISTLLSDQGVSQVIQDSMEASPLEGDDVLVEDDWVPMDVSSQDLLSEPANLIPSASRGLCRTVAYKFIIPRLPPAPPPRPRFTVGRLRLTMERFYLAVEPPYTLFFSRIIKLARWDNSKKSGLFCVIFWILWYHNLLAPALFSRILFSLLRRRILPYPSLTDLRERRREAARAEEFGEKVQACLATSSTSMLETWRLFRLFVRPKKDKSKKLSDAKERPVDADESTVSDNSKDADEEKDVKRTLLAALNDISDLHERVKNIFLWRRPSASRLYAIVLGALCLVSLLFPQYLLKITTFIAGFFFWHVTPVLAVIPAADRSRLPPAFHDVPTDAEYAMELISHRVARGESLFPPRLGQAGKNKESSIPRTSTGLSSLSEVHTGHTGDRGEGSMNWKDLGRLAGRGLDIMDEGKRLVKGETRNIASLRGLISGKRRDSDNGIEALSFPAQHVSSTGIITLTTASVVFSPILPGVSKINIQLGSIRGVKKTGTLKGLSIRWERILGNGKGEETEDKFIWVGGRDELFARLVGWGGRKWLNI